MQKLKITGAQSQLRSCCARRPKLCIGTHLLVGLLNGKIITYSKFCVTDLHKVYKINALSYLPLLIYFTSFKVIYSGF